MKSAILALLAILILGGGAAGAYFYFGQSAEASIGATEEHKAAKEEHKDKSHHKFVEIEPLVLPIIDKSGVTQVVSIVVVIEVGDEKKAAMVTQLQPRLKDAYIQELYGVLNRHAAMPDGVLQVGMVKERLNTISEKVMGEGVIEDVLLQVVNQRPI